MIYGGHARGNSVSKSTANEIESKTMNQIVTNGFGFYSWADLIKVQFNIDEQDVRNVGRSLTFRLSCKELAQAYNEFMRFDVKSKKFCLIFVCDPNKKTVNGVPTARPKEQLKSAFE